MFSINCLFTHKLSKKQKLEILKLKDIHWKHGLTSQLLHFTKNYKKNDLNNLLYYKKKLIGYTGLRKMNVILNKKKINFYNPYYKKNVLRNMYYAIIKIAKKLD